MKCARLISNVIYHSILIFVSNALLFKFDASQTDLPFQRNYISSLQNKYIAFISKAYIRIYIYIYHASLNEFMLLQKNFLVIYKRPFNFSEFSLSMLMICESGYIVALLNNYYENESSK